MRGLYLSKRTTVLPTAHFGSRPPTPKVSAVPVDVDGVMTSVIGASCVTQRLSHHCEHCRNAKYRPSQQNRRRLRQISCFFYVKMDFAPWASKKHVFLRENGLRTLSVKNFTYFPRGNALRSPRSDFWRCSPVNSRHYFMSAWSPAVACSVSASPEEYRSADESGRSPLDVFPSSQYPWFDGGHNSYVSLLRLWHNFHPFSCMKVVGNTSP